MCFVAEFAHLETSLNIRRFVSSYWLFSKPRARARRGWITATLLVAGRVIHGLGMLFAQSPAPRGIAMLMTYGAFLVPAVWLLTTGG